MTLKTGDGYEIEYLPDSDHLCGMICSEIRSPFGSNCYVPVKCPNKADIKLTHPVDGTVAFICEKDYSMIDGPSFATILADYEQDKR